MDDRQFSFLQDLTGAHGPSGFEAAPRAIWRASVASFAAEVSTDNHGSVTAVVNPSGSPRVMLAGHIDEIGLMVSFISDEGFIHFVPIGGHDPSVLVAQRVYIHGAAGPVLGVLGRKPVHLMRSEERKDPVELKKLWIDIGVPDRAGAEAVVSVGDPITFAAQLERLQGDLLVAKAFDNRVGAYVVAEAARAVASGPLEAAVYAVATSQEEVGYRGAITSAERIKPDVAIAIDVGFSLDHPDLDPEDKHRGHTVLGKGPQITRGPNANPVVYDLLTRTAKEEGIPFQIDPAGGETGTDAWAIQVAHQGVATGVVSVSLRYMHTPVEILSTSDLDHTVALLAGFIRRLTAKTSFIVD
ncbi:MAG TPA: M42 family metallopeptidase [Chloroflexota bacterium]